MKQNDWVLQALRTGPLTPLDALREFGIFRLGARIHNLREEGHNIRTELVQVNGKRFAMYHLLKGKKK